MLVMGSVIVSNTISITTDYTVLFFLLVILFCSFISLLLFLPLSLAHPFSPSSPSLDHSQALPNPVFLLYPPFAFFRIIFIIGLYCGIDQCPLWGQNSEHVCFLFVVGCFLNINLLPFPDPHPPFLPCF